MNKIVAVAAIAVAGILLAAGAYVVLTNEDTDCDVVVTMGWQKEMVDIITQNQLETIVLMPENENPHSATQHIENLKYLPNAELFFRIGGDEDTAIEWIWGAVENGDLDRYTDKTVSCMDFIENEDYPGPEHDHSKETHGNHIWMNPQHLDTIPGDIAEVLKEKFSGKVSAETIDAGLADYNGRVGALEDRIADIVDTKEPGQDVFIWHNSLNPLLFYFNLVANDYESEEYDVNDPNNYGDEKPFINVFAGEDEIFGGITFSQNTVAEFFMINGASVKVILMQKIDPVYAGELRGYFETQDIPIGEFNPSGYNYLEELGELLTYLEDNLDDKAGAP